MRTDDYSLVGGRPRIPMDLDLVMKLRETEGSKYTQRDTPIFTCVQMPVQGILDQLF